MKHPLRNRLRLRLERGATTTEYALLIALIAAMIVVTVAAFGTAVSDLFGIPPGYL